MSTPVSSGPEAQSTDEIDFSSTSELSSLQTTPACSPLSKKSFKHTSTRKDGSLVLKLSFSDSARLEKINLAPPSPALQITPALRRSSRLASTNGADSDKSSSKAFDQSSTSSTDVSSASTTDALSTPITDFTSTPTADVLSTPTAVALLSPVPAAAGVDDLDKIDQSPSSTSSGQNKRSAIDADFVDIENGDTEVTLPAPKKRAKRTQSSAKTKELVKTASKSAPKEPAKRTQSSAKTKELVKTASKSAPKEPAKRTQSSAKTKKSVKTASKYWQSVQENLPEPLGKPPVWASTRQALCETLPYYKAYQSGPYTNEGRVYGLLIDKEGSDRDVFNEEIIITRVGGGREKVGAVSVQKYNTENNATHAAFQYNQKHKIPVAVIAGQGKKPSLSKMPHYYNVLAWYHVTDVWCEMTFDEINVPMCRLEKIDLSERSWWAAAGTPGPDPQRNLELVTTVSQTCPRCREEHPKIFQQGWCCLNTACQEFFQFNFPSDMSREDFYKALVYDPSYLEKRTPFQGKISQPLVPQIPAVNEIGSGMLGYESKFGKGVVCPECNGCSRRTQWKQWSCENPNCSWTLPAVQAVVSIAQAINGVDPDEQKELRDDLIRHSQDVVGNYTVVNYRLPGARDPSGRESTDAGIIRHYKSNAVINSQPNGPNDLFRQMQEGDFGMQRKPCRLPGSPGETLANHFYMNWGAPYKFVAPVETKAFSQAPPPILRALMRMTYAGHQTINGAHGEFVPFNELLAVGYFEDGSMGYHDDGESTLGPSVASLSLGSSSTMSFRPKKNAAIGPDSKNQKGEKPALLKITLKHGDIIVMHGADIQKLYEHQVEPHGKLRFVLTCRHIVSGQIPNVADREKARIDGALPDDIQQYEYSGDLNAQLLPPPEEPIAKTSVDAVIALYQTGTMPLADHQRLAQFFADADYPSPTHT